jgi:hypothetical protein
MKYRLLHIAFLIFFWISWMPLFSQEEGPEYFVENISFPGGSITDGINPEDIIFADNKYFIAGLGTVLVLDADFHVVNTINLSERGQYGYDAFSVIQNLPSHNLMAFDGNNKLFVLSPDNEICVINTTGSGTLADRIARPSSVPLYEFSRSIIRYDHLNQRVFWVITWNKSYLGWYDANSYDLIWDNNSNLFTDNDIFDIVINNSASFFYLARRHTIEVCESNFNYFHKYLEINSESPQKELLHIHTDELHRVYCCTRNEIPDRNIYWIDGDDNSYGSFLAPSPSMHAMTFIPNPYNELILGSAFNVYIYNAITNQLLTTKSLPSGGNDVCNLESFNNKIYVSMRHKIYTITEPNHTVEEKLTKWNNYFGRATCGNSGDIVITNMAGASLEIFKNQGMHENILTGVSFYKSCYNIENHKFYFYSDELRDFSKIVIVNHNLTDNSYNLEDIISYDINGLEVNISSCCYNEFANHLLISSYSETQQIKKCNGNNNQDAGYISLENGFCENVFITPPPDNKIYCATAMNSLSEVSIEIFDASDYSPLPVLDGFGTGYEGAEFRTKFCYNTRDNDVYFILFARPEGGGEFTGKLIKIDIDNGYSWTPYELSGHPDKIIYCEACNQIYIKYSSENFITQFDCNKLSDQMTNWPWNSNVIDIEYGKSLNSLYVLYDGSELTDSDSIQIHDCSQPINERWPIWSVPTECISIKFNDYNQRLYAFSRNAETIDMYSESYLTVLDEQMIASKNDLYLHNSECNRLECYKNYNDLTIDPVTGYLLTPNGSHSNVSVIRCPEKFELTRSINWISFPRLDRNPQNDEAISSVDALTDRILPGPDETYTGHMYYLAYNEEHPATPVMTSIDKNGYTSPWDPTLHNLNEVFSNRGYQLQVTPDKKSIYFYGQIQAPEVQVALNGTPADRFCNWVGYYLPYPQNPFDAIPGYILEDLRFMAGQYWSCVFDDPTPYNPGPGCWRCAYNLGKFEINYGDMVKLTSISNDSFIWEQNNSNEPSIDKLKAESFTYTEQYNYDAIFIELDTNDMPAEIGAFAGDSCVGATKVLPSDTTVLICAYTEGYEGENITFEFSYETKAARTDKPDYFVLNPNTGICERRQIKIEAEQSFHIVSFKSSVDNQENSVSTGLCCYPNPASDAFSVSYYIPEDAFVKLEMINPLGIKVLEKQLGYQMQGNHSCDIQAVGLPIGYYFVSIYTADRFYVGKILVNH